MSKIKRKVVSLFLTFIICLTSVMCFAEVSVSAADFDDLNVDSMFLKQNTSNTCTLSSAAMMLRRTAVCAGYINWGNITEANIRSEGWIDGVGLRWSFSCYDMTVGHGYFSGSDNKLDMIDLLEKYPQGVVVYNGGNEGQHHAVFLCDYDEDSDTFYVADPTSTALAGRIKLEDSTIVGDSQTAQINNFTAYWYVSDPIIEYKDGNYSSIEGDDYSGEYVNNQYDPTDDCEVFDSTKTEIDGYYVVTDTSSFGSALRNYPSGNSSAADYVKQGTILYITHQGNNKFGALWYLTSDGYYIFNSNITPFAEYSAEVQKFSSTAQSNCGTYTVASRTALRLEPSEGNNIVAYADSGTFVYIIESGVNSVGAEWYKTEEGYYIKASETDFKAEEKISENLFDDTDILIEGFYSAEPVSDAENAPTSDEENIPTSDEENTTTLDEEYTPTSDEENTTTSDEENTTTSDAENTTTADAENTTTSDAENPITYDTGYYEITASSLNVRVSAVNGAVLTSLPKGTIVNVLEVSSDWGKIEQNGIKGWISLKYARTVDYPSVPLEISSLKLSETRIEAGNSVTCTIYMSDDISCLYKYSIYDNSGNLIFSDSSFKSSSDFSYIINTAGCYYFAVEASDSFGRTATSYSANFVVYDKLQLDSVTSNVAGFKYTYDTIIWSANASGISSDMMYNYSLYHDGELICQKQSKEAEFSYTPELSGKYVLEVYLSDELSKTEIVVADTVDVYSALSIDAINLSSTSSRLGSETSCSIAASGGTGEYTYCFSVFKDDILIKNGTFSSSAETIQAFNDVGTYKFFCTVMDSGGMLVSSFSANIVIFDQMTGDVDSDDAVTAKDARLVLRYSAALDDLSESGKSAADVNSDGKINAFDARYILRFAAKMESSFA